MLSEKSPILLPDAPRSFGLGDALKTAFKEIWERFGLVIGISSTWSLALFVGFTVGQTLYLGASPVLRVAIAMVLTTFLLAPATAGVFGVAAASLNHEPQTYGDFWRAARRFGGPVLRMALLHAAVVSLLALNLWYYARVGGAFGITAALLSFDALIVWGMTAIYHFPLLIAQESGVFDAPDKPARRGILSVLRRAVYFTLGRPAYSFGLLLVSLLLTMLLVLTRGLFVILWSGGLACLLTAGTRNLLTQYDVIGRDNTNKTG